MTVNLFCKYEKTIWGRKKMKKRERLLYACLFVALAAVIPAICYLAGWLDKKESLVTFLSSLIAVFLVDKWISKPRKDKRD